MAIAIRSVDILAKIISTDNSYSLVRDWNYLALPYLVQQYPDGECYRATHECADRGHEQVAVGLRFNCHYAEYRADNKCEPIALIDFCYPTHARRLPCEIGKEAKVAALRQSAHYLRVTEQ